MQLAVELIVIFLLVLVNAFLSASEIAIVSARKPQMRLLADDGNRAARRVLSLAESPGGFLATIQIGITLAGFFTAALGAVSLRATIEHWVADIPADVVSSHSKGI